MKALTKTRAIGGSLVVTIPKEVVKDEMLVEGEVIVVEGFRNYLNR
jgi:antitoxin component of MazEF toxin-antitoxin module